MDTTQILKFLFIIVFTTTLLSCLAAEEPIDYYTPENVRKFADFLYEQGDYLRAAGEYQRYLFYQPRESEEMRYKIALCYRFAGQTEQAIQNFQILLRAHPKVDLQAEHTIRSVLPIFSRISLSSLWNFFVRYCHT